ncbi:MAG TPA: hypothetical protein DCL15_09855 [Chloroflexi bacterium]|nr:hypothetical protein [Chloroflexota bacterium]
MPAAEAPAALDVAQVTQQMLDLIRRNNKIAAIKLYHENFGGTLQAAKMAVETLEREHLPSSGQMQATAVSPTPPSYRGTVYDLHQPTRRRTGCLFLVMLLLVAAIIGSVLFAIFGVQQTTLTISDSGQASQQLFSELSQQAQNAVASLSDAPVTQLARFGAEGIGPGKFEDARAIALDNAGHLFVGEYTSGRIQVFDITGVPQGKPGTFLTLWQVGEGDFYTDQFAANRNSSLYLPYRGDLLQYDGLTGARQAALPPPTDAFGSYQDSVAVGADGAVYAVWGGDIVRFDADGAVTLRIENAIEANIGGLETTTAIAVDGLGNIYALGESQDVLVKFGSDGRFIDRIAGPSRGADEAPARLRAAGAVAVDSQGRVYVADIFGIKVYDSDGQFLHTFDTPSYPFGIVISDEDILYVAARTEILAYQIRP